MAANQTEPGDPTYSNVGYSLAGALLDARSKNLDIPAHMRGYERYIWHRVGRGGQSSAPTMITACLAPDFRTSDIKNLAGGYTEDGSDLSFGDLNWVGWGWEGPSGGWAMTIGDLGRLMLILQSDAVISKSLIDDEMRKNHGQLFGNGTRAGLGLELAGPEDSDWFGKGGDILGYTADMKIWPSSGATVFSPPSWGVAFVCNQKSAGKALTGQLYSVLMGGGSSGGVQEEAPPDPLVELAKLYEPFVREFAERHLAQSKTPEDAWLRAKREIAAYPNGTLLVEMVERGELAEALQQLPAVAPVLRILHRSASVLLAWPNAATGFKLQQTPSLAAPKWSDVPDKAVVVGDEKHITAPLKAGERFYRLHKSTDDSTKR
jgi:hypothetical protein